MEITSIWEGLKFTIVAVLIVFGVLAFLGFVLEMFKIIFYHPEKKKREVVKEVPPSFVPVKKEDRLKKIAAIAAVLSLYKERGVKHIKSVGGELNFWRVKGMIGRKVYSKIKTKRWKNG